MLEAVLTVLVMVLIVLVALWGINTLVPFDPRAKQAINVLIVVALVVWLIVYLFRMAGIQG